MQLFTLSQLSNELNLTRIETIFKIVQENYYYFATDNGLRFVKMSKEAFAGLWQTKN